MLILLKIEWGDGLGSVYGVGILILVKLNILLREGFIFCCVFFEYIDLMF